MDIAVMTNFLKFSGYRIANKTQDKEDNLGLLSLVQTKAVVLDMIGSQGKESNNFRA